LIQGNRIGTDISGSNAVGNVAGDGISLISAPGNLVCSNLISGNGLAGVSVQGVGGGNQVFGNYIGSDVNGKLALTNHNSGVSISSTGGNIIGGTNTGAGNLISGNALDGITLTGGTTGNLIQGNLIGLTAAGNSALRNVQNGVTISGGTGNTIGGMVAGARNVISGNTNNGIDIAQVTDTGNIIQGNYIGTDVTGSTTVANKLAGVLLEGSSNTIGGTVVGAGNVISGNTQQGIWIIGTAGNVQGNVIQGNYIGITASGASSLGNGNLGAASAGIGISTASANEVGGAAPGAGNVISANNGAGIFLVGATASGNILQANFIGTDPTGTRAMGNDFEGIYLQQAGTNQIGGTANGAGNLISGNFYQGIFLTNASWNIIQGNSIGTRVDGTNNLGNNLHNIELQAGANNNVIGGTTSGAGNRLAYAQTVYCGVRVRTGAMNDLISGNSIFSNGALGVDLSPTDGGTAPGVNPIVTCEEGVAADAANAGQNFPTLSNVYSGTFTRVRGNLNAKSGQSYTLQFFESATGDSSGYGQGQVYLGQTNLSLGSSCSSNFTAYLPALVPAGWVVTATATDPQKNTSEFSAWVPVFQVPSMQLSLSGKKQLSISWTNNGGSFALLQTTNLTPPIVWLAVTNVPVQAGNFMVTTIAAINHSIFYKLTAP
jgi:titin